MRLSGFQTQEAYAGPSIIIDEIVHVTVSPFTSALTPEIENDVALL